MQPDRDDDARLWDMLDAARSVASMVAGMTFEQYKGDRKTRRAVEREIEIIGEAARGITDAFKAAHPYIPWFKIITQRHRLSHEYSEVQDDLVWAVATAKVAELIVWLVPLVKPRSE